MIAVWAAVLAAAFLIGAIPFGLVVSRLFYRRDIRSEGSGNIGAANALRTLGARGAAAVLVLDALKGALAAVAGDAFGGNPLAASAAFAAMAGHCFSPFLKGRGGKGVATYFGAVTALAWPAGVTFAAVWVATALLTRYSSVASMLATALTAAVLWYAGGSDAGRFGIAALLLILVMHRGNLARLRSGTENVLSLPKARQT